MPLPQPLSPDGSKPDKFLVQQPVDAAEKRNWHACAATCCRSFSHESPPQTLLGTKCGMNMVRVARRDRQVPFYSEGARRAFPPSLSPTTTDPDIQGVVIGTAQAVRAFATSHEPFWGPLAPRQRAVLTATTSNCLLSSPATTTSLLSQPAHHPTPHHATARRSYCTMLSNDAACGTRRSSDVEHGSIMHAERCTARPPRPRLLAVCVLGGSVIVCDHA